MLCVADISNIIGNRDNSSKANIYELCVLCSIGNETNLLWFFAKNILIKHDGSESKILKVVLSAMKLS